MKTTFLIMITAALLTMDVFYSPAIGYEKKSDSNFKADKVVVYKSRRRLVLVRNGEALKSFKIALGENPEGHKIRQGDSRTPEGEYILDRRNPESNFHLSIHISYPNRRDRMNAQKHGVSPGGNIMIHGLPNGLEWIGKFHTVKDWTEGCIAVTNREIEEIWQAVEDGTPIEIHP